MGQAEFIVGINIKNLQNHKLQKTKLFYMNFM